jgi:hypothetical protein
MLAMEKCLVVWLRVQGGGNVRRVLADGACDSKNNFRMLASNNIEAVIRVRKNASLKADGCMPRKFAVLE